MLQRDNIIQAKEVVAFLDLPEDINKKWEDNFYTEYGHIKTNALDSFLKSRK